MITENEFKETEIGLIPYDWAIRRISEIASIKYGKQKPKNEGRCPVIGSSGIYAYSDVPLINFETLIVGRKGNAGTVQLMLGPCWPADTTFYLEWLSEDVNVQFLYYFMSAHRLSGEHAKTTLPSVQRQDLENYLFPVPSIQEQSKIVMLMGKLQQAIEHQEKIIEKTKELKRSLMHRLFAYGLRGEELKETVIGTVPISWNKKDLEQVADIVYGAQAAVAHALDSSIGTPIFTNINITNEGQIDLTTLRYYKVPGKKRDRLMLKKGDILFNWRSGSKEHVGKTALFELDGEYTFSSFILRFRASKDIHNRFLVYYLYYLKSIGYFSQYRDQSSVNSVFNASASAKIPVFVPGMDEQKEIAAALNSIDRKIGVEKCRSNSINALFRTMLNNLMTGQVRVKDIDFGEINV